MSHLKLHCVSQNSCAYFLVALLRSRFWSCAASLFSAGLYSTLLSFAGPPIRVGFFPHVSTIPSCLALLAGYAFGFFRDVGYKVAETVGQNAAPGRNNSYWVPRAMPARLPCRTRPGLTCFNRQRATCVSKTSCDMIRPSRFQHGFWRWNRAFADYIPL